jgi:hypothetical protein
MIAAIAGCINGGARQQKRPRRCRVRAQWRIVRVPL